VEEWRLGCKLKVVLFLSEMADPISTQMPPDELFLDMLIHLISDYGLIDDFLASAGTRLMLPFTRNFQLWNHGNIERKHCSTSVEFPSPGSGCHPVAL